jgi:Zn-dependent protease
MSNLNNKLNPEQIILIFLGFFIAVIMREAARAIVARALGDRSLETESRATLNPLPHVDLLGTIILPIAFLTMGTPFLIGWAKPHIIDTRYFKSMKRDINIAELSGPAANFLIAALCALALIIFGYSAVQMFSGSDVVPRMLFAIAQGSIVIGIFNLLPFPHSSGWRLIKNNVNYNISQAMDQHANIAYFLLLALLLTGILSPLFHAAIGLFVLVVQILT